MTHIPSRAVARLCMVLAMLLLTAGCDIGGLFGGSESPAADAPADEGAAGDDAPADEPPSDEGTDGHDHGEDGAAGTGDEAADEAEEAHAGDMPDMPDIDTDALIEGSPGRGDLRIRSSGDPIPSEDGPFPGIGTFRVFCQTSHQNFDDPIVFPGQVGASHLHTFFGNTATDADSTAESIAGSGNSTCTGGIADRSGYWKPSVIDTSTDAPIAPSIVAMYYQSGFSGVDAASIQPIPEGLKMLVGDPTRTPAEAAAAAGGFSNIRWGCWSGGGGPQSQGDGTTIPECSPGQSVSAIINFPQCWDGENLDSEDHLSHMAYPGRGQCPESHPVAIPALMMFVIYPTDDGGTADWRLSSDMYPADEPAGASLHADFINGWDPEIQQRWVDACVRAELDCERSELGDGESLF